MRTKNQQFQDILNRCENAVFHLKIKIRKLF